MHKKKEQYFFSNLFDKLYPINRSILGDGYNKSINLLNKYFYFQFIKFNSGKKIFDWIIPNEWIIKNGYILTPNKKKICNFKKNNLHFLNYSQPINKVLKLEELKKILFTDKRNPNAIPYTFSYYKKKVGFNISFNEKKMLKKGSYQAYIDSYFKRGKVVLGVKTLKGKINKDFLLSSYLCHPSMANNELSGPLVLLGLYNRINNWKERQYNYKFLINPETIGSLCYLHKFKNSIKRTLGAGLVLTCLGGPNSKLSLKKTKEKETDLNKFIVLFEKKRLFKARDYDPITGSDERQYCSPGFNLPVGQAARTIYRQYKEYHTSLDNKKFMNIRKILNSINELEFFLNVFDKLNKKIIRKNKYFEVFLEKFGLYKNKNSNDLTKSIIYTVVWRKKK